MITIDLTMPVQEKRPPPSVEEIEERRKRSKVEIPEGMSKSQWKKQQKDKRWEETKTEYRRIQKQKKKERQLKAKENGEERPEKVKKKAIPEKQIKSDVSIIFDCEFDELMNPKEIASLSNQIARAYSAQRHCDYELPLKVSSFNKNLKIRFDKAVANYKSWKDIEFVENDKLVDLIPEDAKDNYVYLTADTDEVIETLVPGTTYIIGGIVDKNRHKNLCVKKAKELGLKVGKLPIDKYIEINGRTVLATSHVYEICCKWFENNQDWEKAFNDVLPPRKLKPRVNGTKEKEIGTQENQDAGETSNEDDEDDEDDNEEDEYVASGENQDADKTDSK